MFATSESDRVRQDQIQFARSMDDGRPRIEGRIALRGDRRPQAPAQRPARPGPVGHEALLRGLEQSRAEVTIEKISSGARITGTVKCSDHYTISLVVAGTTHVIFKHDISEFIPAAKPAVDGALN